jgi:hypothetical protein
MPFQRWVFAVCLSYEAPIGHAWVRDGHRQAISRLRWKGFEFRRSSQGAVSLKQRIEGAAECAASGFKDFLRVRQGVLPSRSLLLAHFRSESAGLLNIISNALYSKL